MSDGCFNNYILKLGARVAVRVIVNSYSQQGAVTQLCLHSLPNSAFDLFSLGSPPLSQRPEIQNKGVRFGENLVEFFFFLKLVVFSSSLMYSNNVCRRFRKASKQS